MTWNQQVVAKKKKPKKNYLITCNNYLINCLITNKTSQAQKEDIDVTTLGPIDTRPNNLFPGESDQRGGLHSWIRQETSTGSRSMAVLTRACAQALE